jgi:hypothetical protein
LTLFYSSRQVESQNAKLQASLLHLNSSLGGVLGGIGEVSQMVNAAKTQLGTYDSQARSASANLHAANQGAVQPEVAQLLQEINELRKSQTVLNAALERSRITQQMLANRNNSMEDEFLPNTQGTPCRRG